MAGRGGAQEGGRPERLPEGAERAADELYGLPLDEFVARRKDLAKELRAEDRAAADAVAALRKPTLPAWTANQLVRRRELDVRRLLKAGESLGKRSKDAESFREARREESTVVRRLLAGAREILEAEGRSPSDGTVSSVANLLRSAATDETARELLAKGRLTGDVAPADSFDLLSAALPAAGSRRASAPAKKEPDGAAERKAKREAEAEAKRLEREAADAERRLAEAEQSLRQAEKELADLRKKARAARERANRA